MRRQLIAFAVKKPVMAKADLVALKAIRMLTTETVAPTQGVVLPLFTAPPENGVAGDRESRAQMPRQRHAVAAAR